MLSDMGGSSMASHPAVPANVVFPGVLQPHVPVSAATSDRARAARVGVLHLPLSGGHWVQPAGGGDGVHGVLHSRLLLPEGALHRRRGQESAEANGSSGQRGCLHLASGHRGPHLCSLWYAGTTD